MQLRYLHSSGNVTGLDRFGRVVDQIWETYDATPVPLDHYTYEYDRAGNRVRKTNELDNTRDETYVYDNVDRLKEWYVGGSQTPSETWTLDSLGNNRSTTLGASYNLANEETPTGQSSDPYDAAGNMLKLRSGDSAIYDGWNRLKQVTRQVGETLTTVETYEYDGQNRRVRISSNYTGTSFGAVEDDYYSGQQVIQSYTHDGSHNLQGSYQFLWSPRYIDAPILRDHYNSYGTLVQADRILYLGDANYNVTGLLKYNSSTWQVVERYTFTPYGVVTVRDALWAALSVNRSQSGIDNAILYTGKALSWNTMLQYSIGRYYDALLERFVNRDPIGYRGGINLYEYVGDDPTGYTDATGTGRWEIGIGGLTIYDSDSGWFGLSPPPRPLPAPAPAPQHPQRRCRKPTT